MQLKSVGFFKELDYDDANGPNLHQLVDAHSAPRLDEARIVNYLRTCPLFIASPGIVDDVINSDVHEIATVSTHTDGVWTWPDALAYYVDRYHISLSKEFVRHIKQQVYRPSSLSDAELMRLADDYIEELSIPTSDGSDVENNK